MWTCWRLFDSVFLGLFPELLGRHAAICLEKLAKGRGTGKVQDKGYLLDGHVRTGQQSASMYPQAFTDIGINRPSGDVLYYLLKIADRHL